MPTKTTTEPTASESTIWERLAAPFSQEDLERLPRNLRKGDDNRGRCSDTAAGRHYSADGFFCNGWHARSVHLDYVGHAGITTRLNDVLGPGGWDFQPMARTDDGLPLMRGGEFWAILTVTVPGQEPVSKADLAANFNMSQEAWGDALRRCAMRFGVGTYLWSKSEAALALKQATDDAPVPAAGPSSEVAAESVNWMFDRVKAAWNNEAGLRVLHKEIVARGYAQAMVAGPTGEGVELGTLVVNRGKELVAEAASDQPLPEPESAPEEPQAPAGATPSPGAGTGTDGPPVVTEGLTDAQRLAAAAQHAAGATA